MKLIMPLSRRQQQRKQAAKQNAIKKLKQQKLVASKKNDIEKSIEVLREASYSDQPKLHDLLWAETDHQDCIESDEDTPNGKQQSNFYYLQNFPEIDISPICKPPDNKTQNEYSLQQHVWGKRTSTPNVGYQLRSKRRPVQKEVNHSCNNGAASDDNPMLTKLPELPTSAEAAAAQTQCKDGLPEQRQNTAPKSPVAYIYIKKQNQADVARPPPSSYPRDPLETLFEEDYA